MEMVLEAIDDRITMNACNGKGEALAALNELREFILYRLQTIKEARAQLSREDVDRLLFVTDFICGNSSPDFERLWEAAKPKLEETGQAQEAMDYDHHTPARLSRVADHLRHLLEKTTAERDAALAERDCLRAEKAREGKVS